MRKNFALLGATIVVCLAAEPALANNEENGQGFKPVASSLTSTVKSGVASRQTVLSHSEAKPGVIKKNDVSLVGTKTSGRDIAPVIVRKKPAKKKLVERLVAKINLSSQTMNVLVNGRVKHSWKISSGARGFHTPTGSYKPYYMTSMHYSKKYNNAPMPHSVFFRGGYAIHATGSVRRLGNPASHGCIRLSPRNARKFFKLVQRYKKAGTRIRISGSTPASRSFTKRYARTVRRRNRNSWAQFGGYGNNQVRYTVRRRSNATVRRIRIGRPASRRRDSRILNWSF